LKRLLCLDISTKNTGWSIMDCDDKQVYLVDYGDIPKGKKETIEDILVNFETTITKLVEEYSITNIVAEAVFYCKNVDTIAKLYYLHGIMNLIAKKHNIPVVYYPVMTLKSLVLDGIKVKNADGTRKTGDELKKEVQKAVITYFGEDKFKKELNLDISDSMSCGIAYVKMGGLSLKDKEKQQKAKKSLTKKTRKKNLKETDKDYLLEEID